MSCSSASCRDHFAEFSAAVGPPQFSYMAWPMTETSRASFPSSQVDWSTRAYVSYALIFAATVVATNRVGNCQPLNGHKMCLQYWHGRDGKRRSTPTGCFSSEPAWVAPLASPSQLSTVICAEW